MNRRMILGIAGLPVVGVLVAGQSPDDRIATVHPAIEYGKRATNDPVADLNRRLMRGTADLKFAAPSGYLRSLLDLLRVPLESQMLVYSETSLQSNRITKASPRALYFNDSVSVGWVQDGNVLEVSSVDPEQGVVFYLLSQQPTGKPRLEASQRCLEWHQSPSTRGVPGLLIMSMLPLSDDPNEYAVGWSVDQRTPIEDRWGGWYVTGAAVPNRQLGNVPVYHVKKSFVRASIAPRLTSVTGVVDTRSYLTPCSDIAALMVFTHQAYMTDLITV